MRPAQYEIFVQGTTNRGTKFMTTTFTTAQFYPLEKGIWIEVYCGPMAPKYSTMYETPFIGAKDGGEGFKVEEAEFSTWFVLNPAATGKCTPPYTYGLYDNPDCRTQLTTKHKQVSYSSSPTRTLTFDTTSPNYDNDIPDKIYFCAFNLAPTSVFRNLHHAHRVIEYYICGNEVVTIDTKAVVNAYAAFNVTVYDPIVMFNATRYTGFGPTYLHSIPKDTYSKYFVSSSKKCPIDKYSLIEYNNVTRTYSPYVRQRGHIDVIMEDADQTIRVSALRTLNKTLYLSASTKHGISKPVYLPLNITVNANIVDLERVALRINRPPRFVSPPWNESITILAGGRPDPK